MRSACAPSTTLARNKRPGGFILRKRRIFRRFPGISFNIICLLILQLGRIGFPRPPRYNVGNAPGPLDHGCHSRANRPMAGGALSSIRGWNSRKREAGSAEANCAGAAWRSPTGATATSSRTRPRAGRGDSWLPVHPGLNAAAWGCRNRVPCAGRIPGPPATAPNRTRAWNWPRPDAT